MIRQDESRVNDSLSPHRSGLLYPPVPPCFEFSSWRGHTSKWPISRPTNSMGNPCLWFVHRRLCKEMKKVLRCTLKAGDCNLLKLFNVKVKAFDINRFRWIQPVHVHLESYRIATGHRLNISSGTHVPNLSLVLVVIKLEEGDKLTT